MLNVVLCEGKTDAIIISYVLIKEYGWNVLKDAKKLNDITPNVKGEESAYWYYKNSDYTLLCGVGGNSCFKNFFKKYIEPIQQTNANNMRYEKILVITDHDDRNVLEIENDISELCINQVKLKFKNNFWIENAYNDYFEKNHSCKTNLLIVPAESEGALETVLLKAIAETEKTIVTKSENFVEEIKEDATKYLSKKGLIAKAKLGVTFAIISPTKVFNYINEIISGVEWNKNDIVKNTFKVLGDL